MRQTSSVLYIAVDTLIPVRGKSFPGLYEFTAALDHAGIPAVWLTSRSRLQFDEPRRKLGHIHPFIPEDGCAVYLPEDYFHLRPDSGKARSQKVASLRLGRFTCIPVAEALPATSEALEALSAETGVPIVTLRSLSPRELVQNTGLLQREAELARQRDFDELFFFAGASDDEIHRYLTEGRRHNLEFRQHGVFWSAALGANLHRCISELSKLYDRALRYHPHTIGVATLELAELLFPVCDRSVLLADRRSEQAPGNSEDTPLTRQVPLHAPHVWERLLKVVSTKS